MLELILPEPKRYREALTGKKAAIYVGGAFKAFSLVCTHLACTVSWLPEKREFYCPCHEGFFDAEGKVLSGPPPAPLGDGKWR